MRSLHSTRARASVRASECVALYALDETGTSADLVNTGTVGGVAASSFGDYTRGPDIVMGGSDGALDCTATQDVASQSSTAPGAVLKASSWSIGMCVSLTSSWAGTLFTYEVSAPSGVTLARVYQSASDTLTLTHSTSSVSLTNVESGRFYVLFTSEPYALDPTRITLRAFAQNIDTGEIIRGVSEDRPLVLSTVSAATINIGGLHSGSDLFVGSLQDVFVTSVRLDEAWLRAQVRRARVTV